MQFASNAVHKVRVAYAWPVKPRAVSLHLKKWMERIQNHMIRLLKTAGFLASTLVATSLVAFGATSVARPGTVNYAEGAVFANGSAVGSQQIGHTEIEPGQVLSTQKGKAEMLLTP